MTPSESAAKAMADSLARIREADSAALLAAEAFGLGQFDRYLAAKADDLNRRIHELYGTAGASPIAPASQLG